jgi:hypothetical protein
MKIKKYAGASLEDCKRRRSLSGGSFPSARVRKLLLRKIKEVARWKGTQNAPPSLRAYRFHGAGRRVVSMVRRSAEPKLQGEQTRHMIFQTRGKSTVIVYDVSSGLAPTRIFY